MKKICIILTSIIFTIILAIFYIYNSTNNEIKTIKERGVLLVGTTGDYRPMSYYDKETNTYSGFEIELAEDLAKSLGVKVQYILTSWTDLMDDTTNKKFDIAMSGINITDDRKKQALMTIGYLDSGKTILCRKEDIKIYNNLHRINKPKVRVIVNPGGLNEQFAKKHLPRTQLIIYGTNYEIPALVAGKEADVMITETIEAIYYSTIDKNLAAPMINTPSTKSQIGMLLPKENKSLLNYANKFIKQELKTGRIDELKNKYLNIKPPNN